MNGEEIMFTAGLVCCVLFMAAGFIAFAVFLLSL